VFRKKHAPGSIRGRQRFCERNTRHIEIGVLFAQNRASRLNPPDVGGECADYMMG
jgi:hypothetical protein